MKLQFLGTRGYIEEKSRRHRRHTALAVTYRGGERPRHKKRKEDPTGVDAHGEAEEPEEGEAFSKHELVNALN